MITLSANTASQKFGVSCYEERKFLASFTHYLMVFTNQMSNKQYAVILPVQKDNERITQFSIDTTTDDKTNGKVKILETGYFTFELHIQSSSSNLDPDSSGNVIKSGVMYIAGEKAWTTPSFSVPDNVVYYE